MSDEQRHQTNHADEGMTSDRGSSNVRIDLVASDPKHLSAIAIAVSLMVLLYAFHVSYQTARAEYWLQRNEAFLEQLSNQGIKVPCDIRPHNKECKL